MDNIMRNSQNGADFRNQSVEKVFVDMPKFAITEINSGSYLLCKLEPSGICPRIDGRILDSGHSGFAEFNHELGLYVQMELNDFLLKFFVEERLMTCNQYMKCDNPLGENQRCTIQMSCEKR
jgi:hypothetical protein